MLRSSASNPVRGAKLSQVHRGNVRELMRRRTLSFEQAARLVATVAEALDYAHEMGVAHEAGIVHRDCESGNVMPEHVPAEPGAVVGCDAAW